MKKINICSHPKHNTYISTARHGTEEKSFKKAPEHLINYFKLSQTANMCRHCLYETDRDPEYINSSDYPSPIQKNLKVGHMYYVMILFILKQNFNNWSLHIMKYAKNLMKQSWASDCFFIVDIFF